MRCVQAFGARPALAAVAASAVVALVLTSLMPAAPQPGQADEDALALLREEHALAAGYRDTELRMQLAADQAADADFARMKVMALAADAIEPRMPILAAEQKARAVKTLAARMPLATPVILPEAPVAVAPPLQLAAAVDPTPAPRRQGAVVEKVRAVVGTVERLPRWLTVGVHEAAHWVSAQTLGRLPERRFL